MPEESNLNFILNITGLVVWLPTNESFGHFIGVRTGQTGGSQHAGHHGGGPGHDAHHAHTASLTYETRRLSGFSSRRALAPDPLVASPGGRLFARRVLVDEILWLEPHFKGEAQPLTDNVDSLLRLKDLDSRMKGIRSSCLGPSLEGTPAVSRLDVAAGTLSVAKPAKGGPWTVRDPEGKAGDQELTAVASVLKLELKQLRSLTIHSNRSPALRFAGEGNVVASYTVEPARDFDAPPEIPFPHFERAFDVATWTEGQAPDQYRQIQAKKFTVGDRACPPSGGG